MDIVKSVSVFIFVIIFIFYFFGFIGKISASKPVERQAPYLNYYR